MSRANEPMVDLYIQETNQLLDRLEQIIIECEKQANLKDHINEIFRIMHTIKGNSMMMMYDGIAELAHCAEDIFDFYRQNQDAEIDMTLLTDLMLEILDFDKVQIRLIEEGEKTESAPEDLIGSLKELHQSLEFMSGDSAPKEGKISSEERIKQDASNSKYFISPADETTLPSHIDAAAFKMRITFEDGCEMENIRAFTIQHQFKNFSDKILTYPANVVDDDHAVELIRKNGFHMIFYSQKSLDELQAELNTAAFVESSELKSISHEEYEHFASDFKGDVKRAEKVPKVPRQEIKTEGGDQAKSSPTNAPSGGHGGQTHISVDVARIDLLMDLVGELVVSEAMVTRNPDLKGLATESFEKSVRQHRMIINELQDLVMSVRMVPLSLTFQKMNRIVRDMSKKINKKVNLTIIGEDTEVDKNVIEHIGDPLMHIIRNSVDHGIEDPEERIKAGKNETGHVVLEAKHSGGEVWIVIKDDGKGLDRQKILEKAEEKGILTKNPLEMSDSDVYSLIFAAGFSTKDAITEFSGRGVGLDVVSKNITALGGTIVIDSSLGKGTTFTIKIPLTLAIIEGMMMSVGNNIFAVPIISVQESFSMKAKDVINDPYGNEFIMLRGKCHPILRLHKRFNIQSKTEDIEKGILIMTEYAGKSVLLFADEILGEQQLVVKGLSKFMRKVKGISGCALLGDGKISLIIDPSGIVDEER